MIDINLGFWDTVLIIFFAVLLLWGLTYAATAIVAGAWIVIVLIALVIAYILLNRMFRRAIGGAK